MSRAGEGWRRGAGSLHLVRCPHCGDPDDKVVDSRTADDGSAIRRRRECLACGRRFTTYERLEEVPLVVVKRSGAREPFDRAKVVAGIAAAAKNRPLDTTAMHAIAVEVEEGVRLEGTEVPSDRVGRAVLDALRHVDDVAYLRFASVYKGFEDAGDFEREVREVVALSKHTAPKPPRPGAASP